MSFFFMNTFLFLDPFTCVYEGRTYNELDQIYTGYQRCAKCVCVERNVYCDKTKCHESTTQPQFEIITMTPKQKPTKNLHNGFKDIK